MSEAIRNLTEVSRFSEKEGIQIVLRQIAQNILLEKRKEGVYSPHILAVRKANEIESKAFHALREVLHKDHYSLLHALDDAYSSSADVTNCEHFKAGFQAGYQFLLNAIVEVEDDE